MARIEANGIEIDYELMGEPTGRPLVLLRGLGTQRIQWSAGFCERLVEAGHHLILPDNRDAGLSTHFSRAGRPDLGEVFAAVASGQVPPVAYTLDDMADDVAELLDALEVPEAHVAGISMGGMIAQVVAYRHADRVRSLTSIMSSTGNPALPPPTPEAMEALMAPSPGERVAYIEHNLATARVIGSPGYPLDEGEQRDMAGQVFDRAFDPDGVARQFAAIQAHGDRRAHLATIHVPTLVIHGLDDPLVSVEGGRDTAKSIPSAEWLEIPGMGHNLPSGLFDTLASAISAHTEKCESSKV